MSLIHFFLWLKNTPLRVYPTFHFSTVCWWVLPPFGCCGHGLTLPGESPLQVLGRMHTSGIAGSCGNSAFDLPTAAPPHVLTGHAHGLCLHSLAALVTFCLSDSAHPRIAKRELTQTVLACISPLPSKAKHRCTSLLAMGATSLETWLLGSFAHF